MADQAIAEPPKPDVKPEPKLATKEDLSEKAFISVFHRDIGVQLGEPDMKKIEAQPKAADQSAAIVENIDGVPIAELAKRRREASEKVVAAQEPPKGGAAPKTGAQAAPAAPADKIAANAATTPKADVPKLAINVPPSPGAAKRQESAPQPAVAPATPPHDTQATQAATEASEATLLPEEREELEFDRLAERLMPEKKGMAAKRLKFFEQLNQYVTDHPDVTPDSDELRNFITKHKPSYTEAERRKIDRMAIKEEVQHFFESDGPLAEAKKKIFELESLPKITARLEDFEVDLTAALPEELRKAALDKDLDELDTDFPLEAPIARQVYDNTLIAASEFLALAVGVRPYQPEDRTHQWLLQFINTQGDIFKDRGGDNRVRDGRQFVPRGEYIGDPKTWTFSDDEILQMLSVNAKMNIETLIAHETTRVEKITSKRKPAPSKENSPPEPPSPRMGATLSPGAANTKENESPNAGYFKALGLDEKPS